MRSNQVPDNRNFVPSPLSDQTIEKAQADVAKKETSVDNFLAGMILSRAERQNALARWARGGRDASTTPEQVSRVFARSYAQHVEIADDAIPLIRAGTPRRSFPEYDQVCDAICSAVVERLSGFLSSYKFKNDEAIEKLEIPGLGTLSVEINRSEAGIFHEIREIRGDSFRIYNSRSSGRSYKAEFCEFGFPHEIGVVPLGIEKLTLYDDRSGIHLTRNGLEYTNSRSYTGSGGYESDCFRDQLRPVLRCFHETKDPEILARLKIIASEQVERGEIKPYQSVTVPYKDEAAYQKFMDQLGRPLELSFKAVTDEIVQWLQTNVLEKILATPTAQHQRMLPELPPPFPESIGPIYAWMKLSDEAKLLATKGKLSCVDPDERWAIQPHWRLASHSVSGDFPEAAYDCYIWCGIGNTIANSDPDNYQIPGHLMENDMGDYRNVLVEVHPKNAQGAYIVDYDAPMTIQEQWRAGRQPTPEEADAAQIAMLRTLTPITEYTGGFKRPVVLFSRDLEIDEVEVVPGVVHE